MRALVLLLALVLGGCDVSTGSRTPVAPADPGFRWSSLSGSLEPSATLDPIAVLHAWDARRAAAWASGDPVAVAALYVPGSGAGARDVRLLRRYADRGFVVTGMRMQVLGARVLVRRPDLIRVEVVDRLAAAVAVRADGERISLPRDAPVRRTVELRWVDGAWLMAQVHAQP